MPTETAQPPKPTETPKPDLRTVLTSAVDSHFSGTTPESPDPAPKPESTPEPAKAASAPPSAVTTPAPPAKPEPAKEPKGIKELREAYDRQVTKANEIAADRDATAKEKATAFAKASELETRLAARESEIEKDYKPRVARLEKAEKELQQYQEALRVRDYMATPEFHEKYIQPIAAARSEVSDLMAQMVVANADGTGRQANAQDFDSVLASRSLNEAAAKAKELFGPDLSHVIMQFVTRIGSLERSRHQAVQNSNLQAIEWEKSQRSNMAQQRENALNRLRSKADEYLKPWVTDDPEEMAELKAGDELAQDAMGANPSLTPDQFIDRTARAISDVKRVRVMDKRYAKLKAEYDTVVEQLKGYQKSEPTVETRNGGPISQPTDFRSRLEADLEKHLNRH